MRPLRELLGRKPEARPTGATETRQEPQEPPVGAGEADQLLQRLGAAALAAGLGTPEDVTAAAGAVGYREKYAAYLRDDVRRLATITGETAIAAVLDTLTIEQLEQYVAVAGRRADELFGTSPTEGATRVSQGHDPTLNGQRTEGATE